jgi:phosphohistidine phosphatase
MELFLFSSSGETGIEYILEAAQPFLTGPEPLVAYLPAASLNRRWLRVTKAAFRGLAQVRAIDPGRHKPGYVRRVLDRAQALYIPGGNTYLLAQRLHSWPGSNGGSFLDELRQRILSGLPLIAASAGAVLCGPDILTTNDINCCDCTTFVGLGLLPFNLNVHFPPAPGRPESSLVRPDRPGREERLQEYLLFHERSILALEDGAGLHVTDGQVELRRGFAWQIDKGQPGAPFLSAAFQPNKRDPNMKTLLILRHAKSSWDDLSQDDHERPLNSRGRKDAPRIGELLKKQDLLPDLILSSTAARARATAELAADEAGYSGEIRFSHSLYASGPQAFLSALASLAQEYSCVMIVGHNPGLEELIYTLTGEVHPLPTAALAQVELPIQDWEELNAAPQGRLVKLWKPKEL